MPYAPKAHRPHHQSKPLPRRDYRPSAAERGYDPAWIAASEAYWSQHPLCEDCGADSIPEAVRSQKRFPVDHIIPIDKANPKADPLRLDPDDFRTRCRSCHTTKSKHDREIRAFYERLRREVGHEEAKRLTLERYREVMVRCN